MRWRAWILIALVVGAPLAGEAAAGDAGAVDLAALIDRHIDARLATEGVRPAEPADDAEFLRRVHLDLHGVIPTTDEAARLLTDPSPDRRTHLVDSLLANPRYGEHLADLWQGHLVSSLADDQRARADRLKSWLADRFNSQSSARRRPTDSDRRHQQGCRGDHGAAVSLLSSVFVTVRQAYRPLKGRSYSPALRAGL
jgi:hypothetical protein